MFIFYCTRIILKFYSPPSGPNPNNTDSLPKCSIFPKDEVCGTNLKTYDNLCFLKKESFHDPSIHVRYNGSCEGSKICNFKNSVGIYLYLKYL